MHRCKFIYNFYGKLAIQYCFGSFSVKCNATGGAKAWRFFYMLFSIANDIVTKYKRETTI